MLQKNLAQQYLDSTKVKFRDKIAFPDTQFWGSRSECYIHREDRTWEYLHLPIKWVFKDTWDQVGRMKTTRNTCGTWINRIAYECPNHPSQHIIHKELSCNELGCKVCANKAIESRVEKIIGRMGAIAKFRNLGSVKHFSVNVRVKKGIIDYKHYKWLEDGVIQILLKNGLEGGTIFHHGLRINDKADCLYESHHFHVLGWGHLLDSEQFFKKYRFTYVNHGSLDSKEDFEKCCFYILHHATLHFYEHMEKNRKCSGADYPFCREYCEVKKCDGFHKVRRHKNAYRYFGVAHPKKTVAEVIEVKSEIHCCETCGAEFKEIIGGYEPELILNPLAEKQIDTLTYAYEVAHYHETMSPLPKEVTMPFNAQIEDLKQLLMVDKTRPEKSHPSSHIYSDEVYWDHIPIYLARNPVRRNSS